jgi:hypothetical protein
MKIDTQNSIVALSPADSVNKILGHYQAVFGKFEDIDFPMSGELLRSLFEKISTAISDKRKGDDKVAYAKYDLANFLNAILQGYYEDLEEKAEGELRLNSNKKENDGAAIIDTTANL